MHKTTILPEVNAEPITPSVEPSHKVSRARLRMALAIAILADVLQWCIGPFGWVGADQAIDIIAMICTIWLLGFHPLLLPTAVMEFIPVVDWLPSWTGCVLLVIARRKKEETQMGREHDPVAAIVNPPRMLKAPADQKRGSNG